MGRTFNMSLGGFRPSPNHPCPFLQACGEETTCQITNQIKNNLQIYIEDKNKIRGLPGLFESTTLLNKMQQVFTFVILSRRISLISIILFAILNITIKLNIFKENVLDFNFFGQQTLNSKMRKT